MPLPSLLLTTNAEYEKSHEAESLEFPDQGGEEEKEHSIWGEGAAGSDSDSDDDASPPSKRDPREDDGGGVEVGGATMHVEAAQQSSSSTGDAVAGSVGGVGADPDFDNQFDLTADGLENYRQSMIPGKDNHETAEAGEESGGYDEEGNSLEFDGGRG